MVKGVERTIIEIRDTGSGCFERALFFVRADIPYPLAEPTLAGEASRIIDKFCRAKRGEKRHMRVLLRTLFKYAVCTLGGAGAATVFWLLSNGHL